VTGVRNLFAAVGAAVVIILLAVSPAAVAGVAVLAIAASAIAQLVDDEGRRDLSARRIGVRQAFRNVEDGRALAGRLRYGQLGRRGLALAGAVLGGVASRLGGSRRRLVRDGVLTDRDAAPDEELGEEPGGRYAPVRARWQRVLDRYQPDPQSADGAADGDGPGDGAPAGAAGGDRPQEAEVIPLRRPADQGGPDGPGQTSADPTDQQGQQQTEQEEEQMATSTNRTADLGTGGRASISGLVVDWETSVEARQDPETFVGWLQAQAAAARHAAQMVPDLVAQFHGRGPTGHAGVPDQQIDQFAKGFEEARTAEADAYEQWATQYAAYVDAAEQEMTHSYGREVIASAHAAHHG
jgi:hypothetical protein